LWALSLHLCAVGLTRPRRRKGPSSPHNALHRTSDTALARDLAYAFAAAQLRLDALFHSGIDPRNAS
jgi:hypothetical protein